jgi:hypothetical protein
MSEEMVSEISAMWEHAWAFGHSTAVSRTFCRVVRESVGFDMIVAFRFVGTPVPPVHRPAPARSHDSW